MQCKSAGAMSARNGGGRARPPAHLLLPVSRSEGMKASSTVPNWLNSCKRKPRDCEPQTGPLKAAEVITPPGRGPPCWWTRTGCRHKACEFAHSRGHGWSSTRGPAVVRCRFRACAACMTPAAAIQGGGAATHLVLILKACLSLTAEAVKAALAAIKVLLRNGRGYCNRPENGLSLHDDTETNPEQGYCSSRPLLLRPPALYVTPSAPGRQQAWTSLPATCRRRQPLAFDTSADGLPGANPMCQCARSRPF
jgi:hypothetical protein